MEKNQKNLTHWLSEAQFIKPELLLKDDLAPEYLKEYCKLLIKHEYVHTGIFIKCVLSDIDVNNLVSRFDNFVKNSQLDPYDFAFVILIALGEGCPGLDREDFKFHYLVLSVMLSYSQLERQNKGICLYQNFDMTDIVKDRILFIPNDPMHEVSRQ